MWSEINAAKVRLCVPSTLIAPFARMVHSGLTKSLSDKSSTDMSQLNPLGSLLHPLLVALDAPKSVFQSQDTPVRSLLSERTTERRHHPQHRSYPSLTVVSLYSHVVCRATNHGSQLDSRRTDHLPLWADSNVNSGSMGFTPSQEPRAASRRRFEILQGLHHSACHRPAIRSRPSWWPCWRAYRWPVSTCTPAFDTIRSRVDRRRPCCLDLHDWQ